MIGRIAFAVLTLLVFTIPFEKSIPFTKLIGILAFAAGLAEAVVNRRVRWPNLAMWVAAAFIAWSGLTWFWSLDRESTAGRASTFLQLWLMFWLVWHLCRSMKQVRILLGAYVGGAVVASVATIARYAAGTQTYWKRYAAPGFDPNDLGITLALAIPLALYLRNWWARAAVVVCSAAILLTASRTALVAALAGFLVVLGLPGERRSGLALAALLLVGAFALAPAESRQRIATIGQEVSRGTLHKRTTIWKAGFQAWKSHKVLGVGSGAYPAAVRPIIGVPGVPGHEYVAHNSFLSVLTELGVIGFVWYAALLALLAIYALVMKAPEQALWLTVLLVWAIGVSTLTWEHRKAGWILFALLTCTWARSFHPEPEA